MGAEINSIIIKNNITNTLITPTALPTTSINGSKVLQSNFNVSDSTNGRNNYGDEIELRAPLNQQFVAAPEKTVANIRRILDNLDKLSPAVMELLVIFMQSFAESNTAQTTFNSGMILLARDLTSNVADSIKAQGTAQMAGSIAAGASAFAMGAISSFLAASGAGKRLGANSTPAERIIGERSITMGQMFSMSGQTLSSVAQGVTGNMSKLDESQQKMEEHNASVTQSIKENTNQETEKVKELKEFLLRLIQAMDEDIKQARDAAIMGCKI